MVPAHGLPAPVQQLSFPLYPVVDAVWPVAPSEIGVSFALVGVHLQARTDSVLSLADSSGSSSDGVHGYRSQS